MIAFEDTELRGWLTQIVEESPENFLCALAEAALTASAEDYSPVRPVLMSLKRKHVCQFRDNCDAIAAKQVRKASINFRRVDDQIFT
jgi:hypothetical protein